MKHVIYYHERHGALVAEKEERLEVFKANRPKKRSEGGGVDDFVTSKPGEAVADSGRRCAVAGVRWHDQMQAELRRKNMTWIEVEERETFRFGSGDPEVSTKAFIYPVGIYGQNDLVRISRVGGGATLCPGLVGPSELSRWNAVASFGDRSLQLKGIKKHMKLTPTRHPAINLLEFSAGTEGPQFWEDQSIKKTLDVLKDSPQTWAFVSGEGAEEGDDEESGNSDYEEEMSESDDGEQKKMLRTWLDRLDEHLEHLPIKTKELQEVEEEEELIPDYTSDGTVTSHEFGVEIEETEDEDSDEEAAELIAEDFKKKALSKHEKRKVSHHIAELGECYEEECRCRSQRRVAQAEVYQVSPTMKQSGRRFTVLEVFTWSCMVSMVAVAQGWTMLEPVTLPGWNLLEKEAREEAHSYIDRVKPDLIVLAWPCRLWSPLQALNYRTVYEKAVLGKKRQEERPLLDFVCEVALKQRRRGGAVLGENPWLSRAWKEEAIQVAFRGEGMAYGRVDMCMYGLKRPDTKQCLKKPTGLAGTREIVEECQKLCSGKHKHAPVMGAMKINGRWESVSDFAGGYTRKVSEAVIRGAERYLKNGVRTVFFGESPHLPEERFIAVEDEEAGDEDDHHWPTQEDLENLLDKEVEKEEGAEEQESEAEIQTEEENKSEVKRDMTRLMVLHRRLGHPANETLVRTLKLAGAPKETLEEAKKLRCPGCEEVAQPPRPAAQRSDHRPTVFNHVLHIDLKYMKDIKKELYVALSMVEVVDHHHPFPDILHVHFL